MLTPAFAMNQTVTVERYLRRDISADVYSAPETYRARVNFKTRRVISKQREVTASGTVWLEAGLRLKPGDKLTFDGTSYEILTCQPSYDIMGRENHVEVDIQ